MADKPRRTVQLSLFDSVILESEQLKALESPREAFYNIWLIREPGPGFYVVKKESGTIHKRLDTRSWKFDKYILAKHFYQKKILEKTNPNRKTRIYHITSSI